MDWQSLSWMHKPFIDRGVSQLKEPLSQVNFTNFLIWNRERAYEVHLTEEAVYLRYRKTGRYVYLYPLLLKKAFANPLAYLTAHLSLPITFLGIDDFQCQEMWRHYENIVLVHTETEDDYLYSIDQLIRLDGQAYRSKRNMLSQFKERYDFHYETMQTEHLPLVKKFLHHWFLQQKSQETENEILGAYDLLDQYDQLDLSGALLWVKDKLVAWTLGEALNRETIIIHFEKALTGYRGAYQAINQMYLERECASFLMVNRQQDLGIPGLKKAKESYHPIKKLKKYVCTLGPETTKKALLLENEPLA